MNSATSTAPSNQTAQFMNQCAGYIDQLMDYYIQIYPDKDHLIHDPETLDTILNLYRVKDMCYTFLIDHHGRKLGHTIADLTPKQAKNFLIHYDPVSLVEFFNQDHILTDFICENEFGLHDCFKNDQIYQASFQTMIAPL